MLLIFSINSRRFHWNILKPKSIGLFVDRKQNNAGFLSETLASMLVIVIIFLYSH